MAMNLGVIAYYDNRWDETLERYREAAIVLHRRIGSADRRCAHRGEHR